MKRRLYQECQSLLKPYHKRLNKTQWLEKAKNFMNKCENINYFPYAAKPYLEMVMSDIENNIECEIEFKE